MYLKSTLDNGIRIVSKYIPHVRSLSMGVLMDTGIMDEPESKNGLAHLTEHLLFRGTSNRNSMQIARFMDEAGGQMGGFVTRDYSCYTATVLDDYRTFAIELLGDILLNSLFDSEDIEREKRTIIREIENAQDLPDQRADGRLKSHAWAGHYLGKSINGTPGAVNRMTRNDVTRFVDTNYLPDRTVIAAAGNVDHEDFVSQVQDSFWKMNGKSVLRKRSAPHFHAGVTVEHVAVSQVYFSIGIRTYAYAHPQRYDVHVLNKIIGGGISSRLFRRIREERGLVYDIRSEYQAYHDDGLIVIEASTSPEYAMDVMVLVLMEIFNTFSNEDPIDDDELWKAKMQIRGQHLISAESSNTQMSRLATQELYFGRHISSKNILAAIDDVSRSSVTTLSQEILLPAFKNAAVAVVGPNVPEFYSKERIEELWSGINYKD